MKIKLNFEKHLSTAKSFHSLFLTIFMAAVITGLIASTLFAGSNAAWKMDFEYPRFDFDRFHIWGWGYGPFYPYPGTGEDPNEQFIADYAAAGFTMIGGFPRLGPVNADGRTPEIQYELADKYSLAMLDNDVWTANASTALTYPDLYQRGIVNAWTHPSKCGYFIYDEPDSSLWATVAYNAEPYALDDPGKLRYVNLAGSGSASHYQTYINTFASSDAPLQMLSYDHYPINPSGEGNFYALLETARSVANSNNLPLWTFVQATEVNTVPDIDQSTMRWIAWSSVAYGAKCLQYFGYSSPVDQNWKGSILDPNTHEPTERYYWAKEINYEVLALGPTLMNLTATNVGHLGTVPPGAAAFSADSTITAASGDQFLVSKFDHSNDPNYFFMVLNRRHFVDPNTTDNITLTFDPSVSEIYEISRVDGSHILQTLTSNQLTLTVKAGKGRLFRIGSGQVDSYSTDYLGGTTEPTVLAEAGSNYPAELQGPLGMDSSVGLGGIPETEIEWAREGKFGSALRFVRDTADGIISIPGDLVNDWDYEPHEPLTIQFWFKTSQNDTQQRYIFTHIGTGTTPTEQSIILQNGKILVRFQSDNPTGLMTAQSSNSYNNSQWHHLAVVKSQQGQFTLYLDGGSAADGGSGETVISNDVGADDTGFTNFNLSSDSMTLRQKYDKTANEWYLGYIDELAILDEALTPAQLGYYNELDTDPQICGDLGTTYTDADISKNCVVDFDDFAIIAMQWLECSDPTIPDCQY